MLVLSGHAHAVQLSLTRATAVLLNRVSMHAFSSASVYASRHPQLRLLQPPLHVMSLAIQLLLLLVAGLTIAHVKFMHNCHCRW